MPDAAADAWSAREETRAIAQQSQAMPCPSRSAAPLPSLSRCLKQWDLGKDISVLDGLDSQVSNEVKALAGEPLHRGAIVTLEVRVMEAEDLPAEPSTPPVVATSEPEPMPPVSPIKTLLPLSAVDLSPAESI